MRFVFAFAAFFCSSFIRAQLPIVHKGVIAMKYVHFLATIMLALLLALQVGCDSKTKDGTVDYVDDTVITAKVKTALLAEPELKSAEIKVETVDGTVSLSGAVGSQANIQKAVSVTRDVKGVKSIKNNLHLKSQPQP